MRIKKLILVFGVCVACGCQNTDSPDGGVIIHGPGDLLTGPGKPTGIPLDSTEIGNGGDLIQCAPAGPQFQLPYEDGWYVLDYVEDRGGRKFKYAEKEGLDDYLAAIRSLVSFAAPELLSSLDGYLAAVPFINEEGLSAIDENVERKWIPIEKNVEVNDENPSYIPFNCRVRRSKSIMLHQVVVRQEYVDGEKVVGRIEYSYDESLIDKIGGRNLQLSMLLVHEWLWDLYPAEEGRELRKANRTLHSSMSVNLSKPALRSLLNLDRPTRPKRP